MADQVADGADAQAIVAISNPDTADNVAILVPGTSSDVAGIGGNIDRMADLQAQAETIPGSGDTSTIVWLGYDAPDALMDGASLGYAREGAPALRDFTEGLREARTNPDARTTMIGYSYGSAVGGSADAMEGRGLASKLAKAAIAWARETQTQVIPLCPYLSGYLKRHPEDHDIIAPGHPL